MARITDKASTDAMQKTLRQLDRADADQKRTIQKLATIDRGYPVVSEFPTGVSDGFIVFNVYSRRLHMYDGGSWISLGDVGAYLSLMQGMPYLRGFWAMNSLHLLVNVQEQGAQGRTLTNTNATFALLNNRISYAVFNGTTAYLERANEGGLSFAADLVVGCWVKLTATGTQCLISKFGAVGQYSYELVYITGTGFRFQVSSNGTAVTFVTSTDPSPGTTDWYHVVGRFDPSTELAVFVNGVKYANTTSIPAAIFTSTANFAVGRRPDATLYSSSWITMVFLSAYEMSSAYLQSMYEEGIPLFT
jgi:hypothetical protein